MIEVGYFPKRVRARPDWLPAPAAQEICSVSNCVSEPPDGWIQQWRHNWLGWYNTLADARAVVPPEAASEYRLLAYRMHPDLFRGGKTLRVTIPDDVHPEPMPKEFERLGFDCASKTQPDVLGLECSPLSCNGLAREIAVNCHCLVNALPEALAIAERFSVEQPEPGDYYVIEVLEAPAAGRRTSGCS